MTRADAEEKARAFFVFARAVEHNLNLVKDQADRIAYIQNEVTNLVERERLAAADEERERCASLYERGDGDFIRHEDVK